MTGSVAGRVMAEAVGAVQAETGIDDPVRRLVPRLEGRY
jgi:hypothetical protein